MRLVDLLVAFTAVVTASDDAPKSKRLKTETEVNFHAVKMSEQLQTYLDTHQAEAASIEDLEDVYGTVLIESDRAFRHNRIDAAERDAIHVQLHRLGDLLDRKRGGN